ncbi:hypothetical protein ACLB2K_030822 [Fragaria x ananassa]
MTSSNVIRVEKSTKSRQPPLPFRFCAGSHHSQSQRPEQKTKIVQQFTENCSNVRLSSSKSFQSPIADREMCSEFFRVVGVCNGLVCLADDFERYGENFLLWNPSIRTLVVRVVEDQYGWEDEETENQIFVEVYSLAAGSWSSRRIVDPQWSVLGHLPQAFVNGALHWDVRSKASSKHRYFILAFDVGSELLREIMMPESLDWDSFRPGFGDLSLQLTVSGDGKSLALFLRHHDEYSGPSLLDVWVMKEYCVEELWTKLITLRPQGPQRSLPRAVCFRKRGMKQFLAEEKKRFVVPVRSNSFSSEVQCICLDACSNPSAGVLSRRTSFFLLL